MEAFGLDWKLLLAQVVNFSVLLFILYKILYKPILNLLEKRSKTIEESMKTAERIQKEKESLDKKREEILTRAREEALLIIKKAQGEGEILKEEVIKKAQEEAYKLIQRAKFEIKEEKEKMWQDLKKEITDLAILTASSVIKKKLGPETEGELIKEALRKIEEA